METKESFVAQIDQDITTSFKFVGLCVGQANDLFQHVDSKGSTSQEIADRAKCKERYVREWLHHMVMCDVIDVDETGTKFSLQDHRREVLTEEGNFTVYAPVFPSMLKPHAQLMECFKEDGPLGLPFETVASMYDAISPKLNSQEAVTTMVDTVISQVPGIKEKLDKGIKVLEICCGRGELLFQLATKFPNSTFSGVDLSNHMLSDARKRLNENTAYKNINFFLQNACELPQDWNKTFDLIVIRDGLHDISHTSKALEAFFRVLKNGGQLSIFDINLHGNPYKNLQNPTKKMVGQKVYCMSLYHCLTASLSVPGSQGLGAGAGVECFIRLSEAAGFVHEGGPTPLGPFDAHLGFRKE